MLLREIAFLDKIQKVRLVKYVCVSTVVVQKYGMAKLDNDDLKAIKALIEATIEDVIERKELVTKSDVSHLPTKDEFYGKMDEVIGELKATREEVAILGHQVSDHIDRLDRIESNPETSSN